MSREIQGEFIIRDLHCRRCGCTDTDACATPAGKTCEWILPGLCTFCITDEEIQILELIALHDAGCEAAARLPQFTRAEHTEALRLYREVTA